VFQRISNTRFATMGSDTSTQRTDVKNKRLSGKGPTMCVTQKTAIRAAFVYVVARSVAAFQPITLHGQLDTGQPVAQATTPPRRGSAR
jgi:hypothetical protein